MKISKHPKLLAFALVASVLLLGQFNQVDTLLFGSASAPPLTGGQNAAENFTGLSSPASAGQIYRANRILTPALTTPTQAPAHPLPRLANKLPPAPQFDPEFENFIHRVATGEAGVVKGVYVVGVFAFPVVQQPDQEVAYVSTQPDTVTQFMNPAKNGVTALLAHNFLAGLRYYDLKEGQEVRVVYGDSTVRRYKITAIYRFQKLTPESLRSDFIDLATGEKLTTDQVFDRFYRGEHHVTFQTCLEENGVSNWGLTFIIATPL